MPNTARFHLVLKSTPERIYRAFLDPDAMAKWLPPNGFTGKVHSMNAEVGGSYVSPSPAFQEHKVHTIANPVVELQ